MDYNQFVSAVRDSVCMRTDSSLDVQLRSTVKNNGTERSGLLFTQEGINVSPTIYLEEFYKEFGESIADEKDREEMVDSVGRQVLELYEQVRFRESIEGNIIKDYEQMKDHIIFRAVNYDKNQEFLKDKPFVRRLDLALVFYVVLEIPGQGMASMAIQREHLKLWGVTEQEIYEAAGTLGEQILPAQLMTMGEVMRDIIGETGEVYQDDGLYVLSNENRTYGAACLFYEGMPSQLGRFLGESYYVLPSSVHEVLILPAGQKYDKVQLQEMVKEINATQLLPEEVLSDQVYYYDIQKRALSI